MTRELRPSSLAPFGLEKAILEHAERFAQDHSELKVHLDLMPDGQTLPEWIRLALFRIYQVALTNAIRHSGASRVDIRFSFDDVQAVLAVEDNGRGFEVPERWITLARAGHLGLIGASERAEVVGGRLEVHSRPGEGTHLRVTVPLP